MYLDHELIEKFQTNILAWFSENKRAFPWRDENATNYELIISEILLQRTKAGKVAEFFPSFLQTFPNWKSLMDATLEEIVNSLKPIGLQNQKGKRLFDLAQNLKSRKGVFPKETNLVKEMPMMGQYITNAYELFILKKPAPLLDVNMARLLERIFGERKLADIRYDSYLQELCKKVTDHEQSKEINWAILDYASLVCTINKPRCKDCVFREECVWFLWGVGES